jgi:glycosyltransferase involved in cell wall biosynthesis
VLPALGAMKAWMRRQARLAREVDLMLPISTAMAEEARAYGRPLRVIPDLVDDLPAEDAGAAGPAAAEALAARREGRRVALYAGRLAPNKGLDLVVEAAAGSPGWHFLVAGDDPTGDSAARLRERAAGLGNVRFLGWVPNPEMPALYDAADVVLLPFLREEPLSRGMVEALSRGRALAATARGGPLDAVEDGRNGALFDATPGGLTAALARLAGEDLAALGARSRAVYEERFSPRRVVEAHLEAYEWIVGRAGGRRG